MRLVAGYMEKETTTSNHVRRMLSYPAFLGVMAIIVIMILATVAVPSLLNLFNSLDVSLPLATRMLIAIASFITHYKFHVLAGIIVLVVAGHAAEEERGI